MDLGPSDRDQTYMLNLESSIILVKSNGCDLILHSANDVIQWMTFQALLIIRAMWKNLDGPSQIQWTRLNHNNSKLDISSEPLIEELNLDPTVTPNLPYKLRCFTTL